MKRVVFFILIFTFLTANLFAHTADSLRFGRFGEVFLYREKPQPSHVVLFVSGDGGWNLGVIDMARELASLDALVVGIDIVHYLKQLEISNDQCSYPAADFEALSQFVQKQLNYPAYVTPVLVGYSSGATLVYATLVQAPATTFRGAISLGFCPDLPITKAFCKGSGLEWKPGPKRKGINFLPAANLEVPWIALQGTVDQVCNLDSTENYVKQIKQGEIVMLPKVGHGFSVPQNWLPQFKQAFVRLVAKPENDPAPNVNALQGLPLVEVPTSGPATNLMALHITGDGGWGVTDKGLSNSLAAEGIPVVGLNSLKYFWTKRTPEETAKAVEQVLRYYLAAWKKEQVLFLGYSFGADVLPFVINRLPDELRRKVQLVVLLGPSPTAQFEFHLSSWLGEGQASSAFRVLPELQKLKGTKIICFYGDEERDSLCKTLDPGLAKCIERKGGHRLGGNYAPVAEEILREAR
ncbi:MAG: hypothetical protein ALAOOOJD_01748 [bacterium]|nr:hypothetical protein [bacterium]